MNESEAEEACRGVISLGASKPKATLGWLFDSIADCGVTGLGSDQHAERSGSGIAVAYGANHSGMRSHKQDRPSVFAAMASHGIY